MDDHRFDLLTRTLAAGIARRGHVPWLLERSHLGTRRGLLAVVAALPILSGLAAFLATEDTTAGKGRRKRRKKRHKHGKGNGRHRKGKRRNKCRRKSRARICANRCGTVKNKKTCKKRVDCGPCACEPPCPACQVCDEAAQTCVPDPGQRGDACGTAGQLCQSDGACRCDGGSCAVCQRCNTANGVCQPDPGQQGQACDTGHVCTTGTCVDGACVSTPVSGEPGPGCGTICCQDERGEPACCADGATVCRRSGRCGCATDQECGNGEACVPGTGVCWRTCDGPPSCDAGGGGCPSPDGCKQTTSDALVCVGNNSISGTCSSDTECTGRLGRPSVCVTSPDCVGPSYCGIK